MVDVEGKINRFRAVVVGKTETVTLVDNNRIVCMAYLAGTFALDQFSVAGDCKGTALLVDILAA